MKIIPIPLSFGLTDTIYETKMGFKTADVNSAVLQFTSDSDPVGCVATLSMKNETDNSNRFSLVLEQMDVTENPFSYTLGDEIGSSGVWIGDITLKKDLVTVCSQEFRFAIGESLQTSIMDVLIQAKSVDEMMVAIQGDVTEHLGKSDASVKKITAYVNGVVAKLLANDNTRSLQERDRVLAELTRETDYQSWVLSVQTLIDTAVIDNRVQAIIDAYQSTYAQSLFSVTQQLAEAETDIMRMNNYSENLTAMVSVVDDDAGLAVYNTLKPLLDAKGIDASICIPSSWVGDGAHLTQAQLLELQANGWEIGSHLVNHEYIPNLTLEDTERVLRDSKLELEAYGLEITSIMYPSGATGTIEQKRLAKKYYEIGVLAGQGNNVSRVAKPPIKSLYLPRVPITTDTVAGKDTFEYFKGLVDTAILNKEWIIFMSHTSLATPEQMQLLSDVLDYVQSVNVPIKTLREAHKHYKNLFEGGEFYLGDTTDPYLVWAANRKLYDNYGALNGVVLGVDDKSFSNELPSYFIAGKVYYNYIAVGYADLYNLPLKKAGLLKIEKFKDFTAQTYRLDMYDELVFVRHSSSRSETWTPWKRISGNLALTSAQIASLSTVGTTAGDCIYDLTLNKPVYRNSTNTAWVVEQSAVVTDGAVTYATGFSAGAIAAQIRKNNKVVSVILSVKSDTTFTNGTQVLAVSLPVGFRPKTTFATHCDFGAGEYDMDSVGYLYISAGGEISLKAKTDNKKYAHINLTYIVD